MSEWLQPRNQSPDGSRCPGSCGVPTRLGDGEGRCPVGRNEYVHHGDRRGKSPGIWGKIRGGNAGKVLNPAGADRNLHGPADQGFDHRQRED